MKTLFLDLASHSSAPGEGVCVACVSNNETVAIRFMDHRIGDSGILPALEEVLTEAAWTPKDLTNIACVTGPGGFTSLRVAVTLANTWADQLLVPVAGIHLSDLYGSRVACAAHVEVETCDSHVSTTGKTFIWLHSTRKTHLFIRGFGECAKVWPEPTLLSVEEIVASLPDGAYLTGEIIEEHRSALAAKNPVYCPLASIHDVLSAFLGQQTYHSSLLLPWYGRGW